jgi:gliding motility-associated-like protein
VVTDDISVDVVGFRVMAETAFSMRLTDVNGLSVEGKITIGIRSAPQITLNVGPQWAGDGYDFLLETQEIIISIAEEGYVGYKLWTNLDPNGGREPADWSTEQETTRSFGSLTVRKEDPFGNNLYIDFIGAVKDQHGCEARDTVSVRLKEVPTILIPNDENRPLNKVLFPGHSIQVFNAWGIQIQRFGETLGWDGTHSGRPVRSGTYFYNVMLRASDGVSLRPFSGAITVIRSEDY